MGKISLFIFFSCFILGCNVTIAQKNQAKYKSVQIQNSEWLIFNETPKVFNNGDSIALGNSKSAFNPFTNQHIPAMYLGGYNVFEFCGTENYKNVCPVGYHVPTDHDISLIQHLTDTVAGKKHSVNCVKRLSCDQAIDLEISKKWLKSVQQHGGILSYHCANFESCTKSCTNCKNGSKEYKVICEKCQGTGQMQIRNSIVCYMCCGTGTFSYYDDPTILDYKSVLLKKGFPKSFYTVDSYSENPRNPLQLTDNSTEPQLVCKAGKSVTEIRLEKIAREEEQDIVTLANIDKFLKEENLDQAVKYYNKLNFKRPEVATTIQTALDKKYGNEFQEISGEKVRQLIENHTDLFKNLNTGKYEININRNGDLFVVGHETFKVSNISKYSKYFSGFTIDQNAKATINVLREVKPAKNAVIRYQVSRIGDYACKGINYRGKIYRATFWSMSRFHEDIDTEYNKLVPKNTVWLVKSYNEKVIVEGITVSDFTKDVNEGSEKIIKRIPKKIVRIVSLFVFWPAAIIISYVNIN
jgi:hypothetical protein